MRQQKGIIFMQSINFVDIISAAIQALALVVTIVSFIVYVTIKISKIEVKVETLWDFVMRRTKTEALAKGLGDFNSPFKATEQSKDWFSEELKRDIRDSYNSKWCKLSDRELFFEIEKEFGERICQEVCIPNKLDGSCIWVAIDIAKGN